MPKLNIKRVQTLRPHPFPVYSVDVNGVDVGLLYGECGDLTASTGLIKRYGEVARPINYEAPTLRDVARTLAKAERRFGGTRCAVARVDD